MDNAVGVAQLSRWLRESAWPVWLAHGVDRARGGFFEALDLHGKTCSADFRRLRVAARQTYVFSQAHRTGLKGADEAVHLGLRFLERHAMHPEGGYAWRFDLDHAPIDFTRDFYDHAFVLLALASATAVLPAEHLRPRALALLDWIETHLPHPQGGYLESLPHVKPRRQNPHMHFLEALLAAYEVFGDTIFIERAKTLVDVFAGRFFDPTSGALPEYFDEALAPVRENGVFLVEPGHHCEWVWLLHRFQFFSAQQANLQDISNCLMTVVDRFGMDAERGDLIDAIDSAGTAIQKTARLWPQTERLKAEFLRSDKNAAKQQQSIESLMAYLRPDGLWHERRSAEGIFIDQPAPASSLYHLTAAILTVERLLQ
jgi:mannose-6-phosphate isomerase